MKETLIPAVFCLSVLTVCGCRTVHKTGEKEGPRSLVAVVRTLDELRKQPPVKLPNGVTVRLGVSSTEARIGEGVLLYCLTARVPLIVNQEGDRDVLGPITYEVKQPIELLRAKEDVLRCPSAWSADEVLFCEFAGTHFKGKYEIRFLTTDGELLCSVSVTGRLTATHHWVPVECKHEGGKYVFLYPTGGGAARPSFHGYNGICRPKHLPKLPLDDNAAPTGDFSISLERSKLTMSFDSPVHCEPRENLLWRWWINGKPVVETSPLSELLKENGRKDLRPTASITGTLEFDGAKLGVKPGDMISLQILYCPWGWQSVRGLQKLERLDAYVENPHLRLSNRIEFKYEGK